jgi:hypothetical protein
MARQVVFSGEEQTLSDISEFYVDTEAALSQYYSLAEGNRFALYTLYEISEELYDRTSELNRAAALSVLASVEAAFRVDYLQRVYQRKKDKLSAAFRALYKRKGERASLDQDIFEAWKKQTSVSAHVIGQVKAAFEYRHWLAHGRYWTPNFGQRYDYQSIYALAQGIFKAMPLIK